MNEVLHLYGEGGTPKAAEKDLQNTVKILKGYGVKISDKPEERCEVLFHKGEKIGNANLHGQGDTYQNAVNACVEGHKITQDDHHHTVRVFARYKLEQKIPPGCEVSETPSTITFII